MPLVEDEICLFFNNSPITDHGGWSTVRFLSRRRYRFFLDEAGAEVNVELHQRRITNRPPSSEERSFDSLRSLRMTILVG